MDFKTITPSFCREEIGKRDLQRKLNGNGDGRFLPVPNPDVVQEYIADQRWNPDGDNVVGNSDKDIRVYLSKPDYPTLEDAQVISQDNLGTTIKDTANFRVRYDSSEANLVIFPLTDKGEAFAKENITPREDYLSVKEEAEVAKKQIARSETAKGEQIQEQKLEEVKRSLTQKDWETYLKSNHYQWKAIGINVLGGAELGFLGGVIGLGFRSRHAIAIGAIAGLAKGGVENFIFRRDSNPEKTMTKAVSMVTNGISFGTLGLSASLTRTASLKAVGLGTTLAAVLGMAIGYCSVPTADTVAKDKLATRERIFGK